VPTVAVVGRPERSGVMSEPLAASTVVAVLFAVFGSFVAPVVPVTVDELGVVGVPETVHVIAAPGATEAGGTGEHAVVRPAGKPVTAQLAAVAAIAGAAAFEQVNVPVYGTPTFIVVGKPLRSILISEPTTATAFVALLLPPLVARPLVSLTAPVVTATVFEPAAVGVPETGHEMLAPAATVAGGAGVQVPTVTPGGKPVTAQVALVALAVAVALFVHKIVPV
jgi:hypothetical protein